MSQPTLGMESKTLLSYLSAQRDHLLGILEAIPPLTAATRSPTTTEVGFGAAASFHSTRGRFP